MAHLCQEVVPDSLLDCSQQMSEWLVSHNSQDLQSGDFFKLLIVHLNLLLCPCWVVCSKIPLLVADLFSHPDLQDQQSCCLFVPKISFLQTEGEFLSCLTFLVQFNMKHCASLFIPYLKYRLSSKQLLHFNTFCNNSSEFSCLQPSSPCKCHGEALTCEAENLAAGFVTEFLWRNLFICIFFFFS